MSSPSHAHLAKPSSRVLQRIAENAGAYVMGVAALHCVFGVAWLGLGVATTWLDSGLTVFASGDITADVLYFDALAGTTHVPSLRRMALVWFVIAGIIGFSTGWLMHQIQHHLDTKLPARLGWGILFLAFAGITLMPISGFWLLLPVGVAVVRHDTSS